MFSDTLYFTKGDTKKKKNYTWKIKQSSEASSWSFGGQKSPKMCVRPLAARPFGPRCAASLEKPGSPPPVGLLWFCQYFGPSRNYFSKIGQLAWGSKLAAAGWRQRAPVGLLCFIHSAAVAVLAGLGSSGGCCVRHIANILDHAEITSQKLG